jgi:hypothetical protein
MIVEKVEMLSRQAFDLCQGPVGGESIEGLTALEEGFFIAKIAYVRTAARHDDGIWHQVEVAFDEITTRIGQVR